MPTHRHDPDLLLAVGTRLRAAREAKGWTQAELAEAIRIEPETLSRYEGGARGPSITVLALAAKALGTSLADLMPTSGQPHREITRPEIARAIRLLEGLDEHDLGIALRIVEAIGRTR